MTLFKTVNQSVIDGVKCVAKKRPHRHLLLFSIFLMVFTGMNHSGNTQLYVEKVFGWTLPEYTNYIRFVNFFHYLKLGNRKLEKTGNGNFDHLELFTS